MKIQILAKFHDLIAERLDHVTQTRIFPGLAAQRIENSRCSAEHVAAVVLYAIRKCRQSSTAKTSSLAHACHDSSHGCEALAAALCPDRDVDRPRTPEAAFQDAIGPKNVAAKVVAPGAKLV